MTNRLPFPSEEMRALVGLADPRAYDNPKGDAVVPGIGDRPYGDVLDFGCGCGRMARQLIQQRPQPTRYLGIDLHAGMIRWCQQNLAPVAPQFTFEHHDVFNVGLNPTSRALTRDFPADATSFDLVLASSVFTHIVEDAVPHYLRECARVLRPGGALFATWFLFDKRPFPMMQATQNALYINPVDPTNAVMFDREWFEAAIASAGLTLTSAEPPVVRGFHWVLTLEPTAAGNRPIPLPNDEAPFGSVPPPVPDTPAYLIGS